MLKTAVLLRSRGFSDALEMTPGQALFAALTLAEDDRDRHVADLDAAAVATRWGFGAKADEFERFRKDLRS